MTRAKPKPTTLTQAPAKKQRTENAASTEAAPVSQPTVKTAIAKPATKSTRARAVAKPGSAAKAAPKAVTSKAPTKKTALRAPSRDGAASAISSDGTGTKAVAPGATSQKPNPAQAAAAKTAPVKQKPPKPNGEKPEAPKAKLRPIDTPAKIRPIEQAVGVSSDAVARRTGKSWAQWFALLDAAGAAELDHKGIVAVLAQRHGVGPWWQQMVTVAYEQARGKNGAAAADDGFQVDVSKVLELPLAKLFRFWAEPAERNKWLADDRFSIHKATASKSIRARWGRGVSRIDVDFCEKGPSKSQVTVQHNRIETSDAAEQMKAYWDKKIRALEALTRS